MRIVLGAHKDRGADCLTALHQARHEIVGVLVHPDAESGVVARCARGLNIPVIAPEDANSPEVLQTIQGWKPDLIALAGYGKIVKPAFFSIPRYGAVNLHGGRLPQYRGSSPMNWALLRGDEEYTLSIIQVDAGVDTGDVLKERTFPILMTDTISELHTHSNRVFPEMLVETVNEIAKETVKRRKQDESQSAYFPLRFPEDGLICWDLDSAGTTYNRIRALTRPYPGAFAYLNGRKILIYRAALTDRPVYGEPGRIYRVEKKRFLVCAQDCCLWILEAIDAETGEDLLPQLKRYSKFDTLRASLFMPDRSLR